MGRMLLLQKAQGTAFEGFVLIKSVAVRQNVKGADYLDLVLLLNTALTVEAGKAGSHKNLGEYE